MATEIKMPQLSDTMDAGKILTWLKKEGEAVKRGDILAEVETDKANLQIESFQQGVLLKIVTAANSTAKVGDVIAIIGQAGEAIGAAGSASKPAVEKVATPATAAAPAVTKAVTTPSKALEVGATDRIKASPLARKIAAQSNVDLSQVSGTGPNGRIIKKDVEAATNGAPSCHVERPEEVLHYSAPGMSLIPASAAPQSNSAPAAKPVAPSSAAPQALPVAGSLTPLSKMRDTIAKRMQESVRENPHFYVTTSVNMKEASKFRETLKELPEFKGISINHLVIKAAAYALSKEPRVNQAMRDGQLYTPPGINVGIITALPDGLLIPIIKDTDKLSLKDLVFEARAAVDRARAGRPSASDLSGGTFSISNMGMFDVENFTAIINPGQGAILAVSSTKEEPVVENGLIVVGLRMKVTLSVDHRIIDGIMAGTWLKHFKQALEQPALMFV